MTKIHKPVFAQDADTNTAVCRTATALANGVPTNTQRLVKAGPEGAIVTKISAMPYGTITATNLVVFISRSRDNYATKNLRASELMVGTSVSNTAKIPVTVFEGINEETPIRLGPGDEIWVGTMVGWAAGIGFEAEYSHFNGYPTVNT